MKYLIWLLFVLIFFCWMAGAVKVKGFESDLIPGRYYFTISFDRLIFQNKIQSIKARAFPKVKQNFAAPDPANY